MVNPLEIPEILQEIGELLQIEDILSCILVNKKWYISLRQFAPPFPTVVIFDTQAIPPSEIDNKVSRVPPPQHYNIHFNADSSEQYSQRDDPLFHAKLICIPNVDMSGESIRVCEYMSRFIQAHSRQFISIQLSIANYGAPLVQSLWDAILMCRSLTTLTLNLIELDETQFSNFGAIVSQLESLTLKHCTLDFNPGNWIENDMATLSKLKSLSIESSSINVKTERWIVNHCPNLEKLAINNAGPLYNKFRLDFLLYQPYPWKKLSSVSHQDTSPINIYKLLDCCVDLEKFEIPKMYVNIDSVEKLAKLYSHSIRELNLSNSIAAQGFLESCPNLVKFTCRRIKAIDAINGSDWVCNRLRLLRTDISFEEYGKNGNDELERRLQHVEIYKRIGALNQLSTLDLRSTTSHEHLKPGMWLDLRIEYGLQYLGRLTKLRRFMFAGIYQKVDYPEIEWMIRSWKKLKYIEGRISEDKNTALRLEERLQKLGIEAQLCE